MDIDKLILENWPKDVPQDCTNLLNDLDAYSVVHFLMRH